MPAGGVIARCESVRQAADWSSGRKTIRNPCPEGEFKIDQWQGFVACRGRQQLRRTRLVHAEVLHTDMQVPLALQIQAWSVPAKRRENWQETPAQGNQGGHAELCCFTVVTGAIDVGQQECRGGKGRRSIAGGALGGTASGQSEAA